MNAQITEKNYPIQLAWVFKSFVGVAVLLLIFLILGVDFYFWYYLISSIIYFIILLLRRRNFHYSIDDQFINVEQGVLSKAQRHIPFGVIQNIFIKQDLLDRAFGLASLSIENASQGGTHATENKKFLGITLNNNQNQGQAVGFQGNKVNIPGLNKGDAEALKVIVLQKMKENPLEDSHSGL